MTENEAQILDENGNVISKNVEIIEELTPYLNILKETLTPKNFAKCSTQIRNKLIAIIRRKYPPYANAKCYKLTADEIWDSYCDFLDLVAMINVVAPFTPNKLDFIAYSQLSVKYYEDMAGDKAEGETGTDELTLKDVFALINADFVNATLSSAESGAISDRAAKMRSKAIKYGYEVTETDDGTNIVNEAKEALNELYFSQKLELAQRFRPKD